MKFRNLDDAGSVFFSRQLEFVKAKSYDVLYADLVARELFPVSNDGGPGVTSITVRTYDMVGMAKIINGYAKDIPRADASGSERSIPVRSLAIAFGYNVDEIASSQLTGASLDQRRANAARRGFEESVNLIAFDGDAESGLPGFFSNVNIPVSTVVDPGSGTEWVNKTPEQILFDVNDLFADIFETTKMKERATDLLLPPSQWSYIASTPRSSGTESTILKYLVTNSPYLASEANVRPVNELVGRGTAGADIMVAYTPDPDKLQLEIPHELEFFAPQESGLEIEIPGRGRIAGVNIYYPLSASIAEGI